MVVDPPTRRDLQASVRRDRKYIRWRHGYVASRTIVYFFNEFFQTKDLPRKERYLCAPGYVHRIKLDESCDRTSRYLFDLDATELDLSRTFQTFYFDIFDDNSTVVKRKSDRRTRK